MTTPKPASADCEIFRLDPVEQAIRDIAAGRPVVVVDDEDRENEGDLVIAAEKATPEIVAFMMSECRGLIRAPMEGPELDRLELPQMVHHNTESMQTAFTVSVDASAAHGVTTGISAADRATTLRLLADGVSGPGDFVRPGHVFPLRAKSGGVLVRNGHTEAAVDLARLAGLRPAGAIVEIAGEDGVMLRLPELIPFARKHGLTIISIEDLIAYRRSAEPTVRREAEVSLPTSFGQFTVYGYRSTVDGVEHVALVHGEIGDGEEALVRMHEERYGRRALPGEEPHDLLSETVASIRPLDAKALGEAWERQKRMTKPAGALGMLEIISAQLAGLSRVCPPPIPEPAAVAIFAGDHGVHAQGVTPWPQEVTMQMVANFLGGGAVCNAFANQVGAEVCVIDVGVAGDLPATPGLLPRKVRPGTADLSVGPAMTREEAVAAIEVGIETARDLVAAGNKALLTGEIGIANTTVSAALISVFTGVDPAEVTGRGTGINDETHARKVEVVRRALELHQPDPADPIGVLAAIGGLEHAAIVGLLLGGASLRTPVILDGVNVGAAALVARAIAPESLSACIAGHRSAEPGHVATLKSLDLRPLVDLGLRLGEGTGALLALPLVQSAARAMHEVATFDSTGITEKQPD